MFATRPSVCACVRVWIGTFSDWLVSTSSRCRRYVDAGHKRRRGDEPQHRDGPSASAAAAGRPSLVTSQHHTTTAAAAITAPSLRETGTYLLLCPLHSLFSNKEASTRV